MSGKRLYEKVALEISAEIEGGAFGLGDRLPSERDLAKKFEVGRQTIREAIIALEIDGYVDTVTGSGVYVISTRAKAAGRAGDGIGAFELLEARALFEGESAALAARNIEPQELEACITKMHEENDRDIVISEEANFSIHMGIAQATKNSAIVGAIEFFWDAREHSPQARKLFELSRSKGVKPRIDEQERILLALKERDANAARSAIRAHLVGVSEAVLQATEATALEVAHAQKETAKQRYFFGDAL